MELPVRVFSVSELNEYVGLLFAGDPNLTDVRVSGEISGFKRHTSGHLYFSLKDENALVRCVMFRQQAMRLSFNPQDGMQVTLIGRASLYAKDGSFQLYAQHLRKSGDGELFRRFLALKEALAGRGYFDAERKREIPLLPRRVGVITSETGAAVQDIVNIIRRRFPRMPIVLAPVKVQGEGAAEQIADAISLMNEQDAADVLIVGRGGGSIEDLWAFNEPIVAEAVVNSRIPVISAVGHETDFTITDFAADLRAPTPSAAAELAVPEMDACYDALSATKERMRRALSASVERMRARLERVSASGAFRALERRVSDLRLSVDGERERARRSAEGWAREMRARLGQLAGKASAMDPDAVLRRGYALLAGGDGRAIDGVNRLAAGDVVRIHMHDGAATAAVRSVEPAQTK